MPCILGLDFLRQFRVIVDFDAQEWHFATRPGETFTFTPSSNDPQANMAICYGLVDVTTDQTQQLEQLLNDEIPPAGEKLSLTKLAEH